jgi:starvation-inducible DNA-binding protein
MQANIGISADNRKKAAKILNTLLADEFILYTKTLNYHWNVEDLYFDALHALFKTQYEQQFGFVDLVAERVRAVGELALGSSQEFQKNSRLKEEASKKLPTKTMLKNLLADHEAIITALRTDAQIIAEKYSDWGSNNMMLTMLEQHEKTAWMLRACL